jgi:pimeloyl-ACP methyl ester carboxylesterase
MHKSDYSRLPLEPIAPLRRVPPEARPKKSRTPGPSLAERAIPLGVSTLAAASPRWAARAALALWQTPRRHERPARELEVDGRAKQERVKTPAGEVATYGWDPGPVLPWEQRQDRGPVLLVHGWEGRASQLGAFVDPLRQAGFRPIGLDAPAHGRSDGRTLDLLQFMAAIQAVARHHGPLAGIVAHSFGGAASVGAVSHGLGAVPLVLIGSAGRLEPGVEGFTKMIGLGHDGRAAFRALLESRYGVDLWERYDLGRANRAADVPALLIHDLDDPEVPFTEATRMAAIWPAARLIATAGLGHRRILRDPPVIEESINFLLGQPTSGRTLAA